MINAANPKSIRSGDIHHRSVRSVRCSMCARVDEKTPDAGRFAVGALIKCSSSNGLFRRRVHISSPRNTGGLAFSGPVVAPDSLMVDVAPKVAVVIGIGDGDLFAGLLHRDTRQVEFGNVGVK